MIDSVLVWSGFRGCTLLAWVMVVWGDATRGWVLANDR